MPSPSLSGAIKSSKFAPDNGMPGHLKCFQKMSTDNNRITKLRNFVYMPSHSLYANSYPCTDISNASQLWDAIKVPNVKNGRLVIMPAVFQDNTRNHAPVFTGLYIDQETSKAASIVFFATLPQKIERKGFWASNGDARIARVFDFGREDALALLENLEGTPVPKEYPPPKGDDDPNAGLYDRFERYWNSFRAFEDFMEHVTPNDDNAWTHSENIYSNVFSGEVAVRFVVARGAIGNRDDDGEGLRHNLERAVSGEGVVCRGPNGEKAGGHHSRLTLLADEIKKSYYNDSPEPQPALDKPAPKPAPKPAASGTKNPSAANGEPKEKPAKEKPVKEKPAKEKPAKEKPAAAKPASKSDAKPAAKPAPKPAAKPPPKPPANPPPKDPDDATSGSSRAGKRERKLVESEAEESENEDDDDSMEEESGDSEEENSGEESSASDDEPQKKRRKRVIDSVSNIDSDSDPLTSDDSESSDEEESEESDDKSVASKKKPQKRLVKNSSPKAKAPASSGSAPAHNRRNAFSRSAQATLDAVFEARQRGVIANDVASTVDDQMSVVKEALKKYVETGHKEPTETLLDECFVMCNALLSSNCALKAQLDRLSKNDSSTSRRIGMTATDAMADVVEQVAKMHEKQTAAANMMAELAVLNSSMQATATRYVTAMSKMVGELPEP